MIFQQDFPLTKPKFLSTKIGWVAEWTKAAVLKTAVRETVPGVRIPPHPLYHFDAQAGRVNLLFPSFYPSGAVRPDTNACGIRFPKS